MTWDATGNRKRARLPLCLLHAGLPERLVRLEPEVDLADDPAEEPGVQLLGQGVPAV